MPQADRQTRERNRTLPTDKSSTLESQSQPSTPFQTTYHVKTKTRKKGFLGLSPTGKIDC